MSNSSSKNKKGKKKSSGSWALRIGITTFLLAIGISIVAELLLGNVSIFVASAVVVLLIGVGIVFDIAGVAITSADVAPFNAMAARGVKAAKRCIKIVNNASVYSNICNDVVGDICGIISGAAGAVVAAQLILAAPNTPTMILNTLLSAIIAAITVGGKAMGKSFAMKRSRDIVFVLGRMMSIFDRSKES